MGPALPPPGVGTPPPPGAFAPPQFLPPPLQPPLQFARSKPPGRVSTPWYRQPLPEPHRPTLAWALAAAVLADVAFRLPPGSLAAALLVLCLAGLLVTAGRASRPLDRTGVGLTAALALAFAGRSSPWVTSIATSAVLTLVVLVAADGLRTDRGPTWLRSLRSALRSMILLPRWSRSLMERVSRPGPGRSGVVVRAGLVAGAVLVVLVPLLASGDAVFGAVVSSLSPGGGVSHGVVTLLFALPFSALALLALRTDHHPALPDTAADGAAGSPDGGAASGLAGPAAPGPAPGQRAPGRYGVEALTARWAVAGVLALWCGVQVVVVSGGARAVLAEQGLTAAQYARQGFFQLVAVAAVSLLVLNLSQRFLGPDRSRPARVPAVLIGAALGVLIVVTFSRLAYYMNAFGLTMLRLAVATFLAWLVLMTALSVARALGLGADRCWLQSAAVLSAAAFAVLYAAANPAAVVASVNLDRAESIDELDVAYLLRLGPDARGALADFDWGRLGGRPVEVTEALCRPADGGDAAGYGPLGWNRARSRGPALTSC